MLIARVCRGSGGAYSDPTFITDRMPIAQANHFVTLAYLDEGYEVIHPHQHALRATL